MKRILTGILLLMLAGFTFAAYTYAPSSVLSSGSFIKIQTSESGLYAISYSELKNMGLNPESVRIYGYGGAMLPQDFSQGRIDDLPLVPVFLDKGADGVLGSGDRLIFYAQGPVSWTYNGSRFVHKKNTYSDYGYYFLTSDCGNTEELTLAPVPNAAPAATITTFDNCLLHELDSVNLVDRTGEDGGGREFYGETFTPGTTRNFRFDLTGLNTAAPSLSWYISVAAASSEASRFEIKMDTESATIALNGIPASDFYTKATTGSSDKTVNAGAGGQKTIALTYRSNSSTAIGYLNYIELNAVCDLKLSGNEPLFFRTKTGKDDSNYYQFVVSGATAETQIWDITDKTAIRRINASFESGSNQLRFTAQNTGIREYVAFNPSGTAFRSPVKIGNIGQQNLHALSDIDYVIITPAEFIAEAQRLADAHEMYDNMTTAVVTDQQVYNEFSSGTPDASAYRWLMKMLYDRANASGGAIRKPRYLCLFGDGSFDNRRLLRRTENNWLLTYQSKNSVNEVKAYATDDYFGFLDDNEGEVDVNGRLDIGVGRIPVGSPQQATGVVDKLIRHISGANKGKWKSQLIFVADDGDSNLHTSCADQAGEATRAGNPDFVVNKIYLDAYTQEVNASGESYPLAEARLNNLLNSGALLFDYCGHSGYNNASSEGLVSLAGIRAMHNENPAFWIFASCTFALFDAEGKTSAAEEAVLNPDGGAIAVCAATRTVYASQNATLNKHICNALFDHSTPFGYHNRLGDAVSLGKNACGSDENKMAYVLLGDPALSLHFPTEYQVRTTQIADTLNALAVAQAEGYIEAENGDTATWFNGKLSISVFDKMQRVTTLDNDQPDEELKVKYTYNDYPNILFQGETDIVDGRFSYTFMVPKDIRYNFGNGRIVYYAIDTSTQEEGVGHYEDFVIGGSSPVEITDTVGPELTLYLGSKQFEQGDKTNEKPHFFAEIYDENGINTVGSGIGHDLLLIVDNKASETYVLNDYFSAANNSYRQGIVSYQMSELGEGKHTAFFRAWDLLNNSSSGTIEFEVVKGFNPSVVSVLTYPNPVENGSTVSIAFECDLPDVVTQTDIFIYDLSGRLVHTISQRGTETVRWNLAESHTPAGVYLYKVLLSSPQAKACSRTGKLIIKK